MGKLADVWDYICEFESEYKLYSFRVYNYPIWNGCKEKAIELMMGNEVDSKTNISVKVFLNVIVRIINSLSKLITIQPVDVLFVSNSRFRRGDNISKDSHIYFDNIIDRLDSNLKVKFLEYPTLSDFDLKYLKSRHSSIVIPIDIFIPIAVIGKLVKKREIRKAVNEIDCLLSKKSNFDQFLINNVSKWMKQLAEEMIIWTFALKWIYKRLYPKVIIDIANAGRFSQSILNNVKRLEIQHGVIHKFQPAYSFTIDGKKYLSINNQDKHIVVFNDHYKKVITEYGILKEDNITVVKNMRLWNFEFEDSSKIYKKLNLPDNIKIILLSSQPLKTAQKKFSEFIEWFLKLQRQNNKFHCYYIIVKLHPRETNRDIYKRYEKNILIINEEISLLNLLNVSKVHIGYSSTVIEEASDFKLCNLVLNNPDVKEKYWHLIKQNKVIIINKLDEIEEILDNRKFILERTSGVNNASIVNPYNLINNKINNMLKAKISET